MVTGVLAWTAALALCVAAFLFGQTARTSRRRSRRRSRAGRIGLFAALSGPWLAVFVAARMGAVTRGWLVAAAGAACGIVLSTVVGLVLAPR